MSDNFEKAMASIAINSVKNGGPTIQDVLTALVAKNEDDDGRAEVLRDETRTNRRVNEEDHHAIISSIDAHLVQSEVFFARVTKLEAYKEDSERTCEGRVKKLINEEHTVVHAAHMADLHPPERFEAQQKSGLLGEQTFRDMVVGWRFSKWLLGILLVVIVGWALPFWADSCSRQQYWGREAPAIVASPTPTSATP